MARLIIEVSERGIGATHLRRYDSFPVTVGRDYQNDLILQSRFISPKHLTIHESAAGFIVEDHDSENGIYVRGKRITEGRACLVSGDTITTVGAKLRLIAPSHAVPPAEKLSYFSSPSRRWLFCALVWASLIPTSAILMADEYLATYETVRLLDLANEVVPFLMLGLIWAGWWSFIGYSATRRARYHAHMLVANAALVLFSVVSRLTPYVAYAVNSEMTRSIGDYLGPGFVLALLIYCNLNLSLAMKRWRQTCVAAGIATAVILVALLMTLSDKPEFDATPNYSANLKPPCVKLARSRSTAEFWDDSEKVFKPIVSNGNR